MKKQALLMWLIYSTTLFFTLGLFSLVQLISGYVYAAIFSALCGITIEAVATYFILFDPALATTEPIQP